MGGQDPSPSISNVTCRPAAPPRRQFAELLIYLEIFYERTVIPIVHHYCHPHTPTPHRRMSRAVTA
eukprot:1142264-Prorocentrum_minimum.AAC.1